MNILNNFYFFNTITTSGTSETLSNIRGDSLILESYGTATAFSFKVQGIVDSNNTSSWTDLGFYTSTGTTGINITTSGIYNIPINGIGKIRIVLASISGGNLTVFGKVGE